MLLFNLALFVLPVLSSTTPGPPPGNGTKIRTVNTKVQTIHQFEENTWAENIAIRQDGTLLVSLLSKPQLYSIDPTEYPYNVQLAHEFDGCASVLGIAEYRKDVFAVVRGNFSMEVTEWVPGTFSIWRVQFTSDGQSESSQITEIPEAGGLNGIATLNPKSGILLVADSVNGVVWRVGADTGDRVVALRDETMTPFGNSSTPIGVNGIKVKNGYVYYSNTNKQLLCRVAVDTDSGMATGPFEILATSFIADDFAVTIDGYIYAAGNAANDVKKYHVNGTWESITGGSDLIGPTSVAFGRSFEDADTLYITKKKTPGLVKIGI
ncbi:uncharacterized protein J3D65DRAFT_364669 [Phyllosticta citribraziliensis]|uniref:Six-bladed beta-propeller-like protein n=1 Tax=Phyllosticta citribraziliensis TaxID=989973 RepID=A0ABR1LPG8_9PEZI